MTIRYSKTKRNITVGYTPGEKFMAKILYGETVDIDKLSEMIAETSALSAGDIQSVMIQMEKVVSWLLLEGIPVEIGKLGKLHPGIAAKAVATYEEVTPETIEKVYVRFTPSKALEDKLKNAKVEFKEIEFKSYAPKPTPEPVNP